MIYNNWYYFFLIPLHYFPLQDEAQLTYVVSRLYDREPVVSDTKPENVCSEMDPEIFERLVVMTRAVAVNRPENLVRFTNELTEKWLPDTNTDANTDANTGKFFKWNESWLERLTGDQKVVGSFPFWAQKYFSKFTIKLE